MSFHFVSSLSSAHVLVGAITLLTLLFWGRRRISRQPLPYPPGPRPLPIIGNILDMPQFKFSLTWSKFGEQYGPLTWLSIPGQNVLVVNSFEAAKELLEKRGLNYIDRPRFVMGCELIGMKDFLSATLATDRWKGQRAHLKHALSAAVVRREYSSLFEMKAQQYLERCIDRPENVLPETNRIIGEAIIQLTYGKLEDGRGRDYSRMSIRVAQILATASQGYVVDLLPALQHLPKWLPGMKFKRDALRWKTEINEIESAVSELVKENTLSNDLEVQSSFMFKKMQELHDKHQEGQDVRQQHEDETVLGLSGLAIYVGNGCRNVQEKAQAEIDRVVGSDRFPTFNDQTDLPFLHAVILETLRWNPVASFGVPHVSRQDDVYDGYFIPKGTSVMANAWGFSRNSKYYTNPSMFDPERYIKQPSELDPREFIFGYGGRICPGKDLAIHDIWILAVSVLWAFKLVGAEDDPPSLADEEVFLFSFINHPTPFKCRFVPRREGLKDKLGFATA